MTLGAGGAYDTNLYDVIDLSDLISNTEVGTWVKFGNAAEQVFGFSTDRNSAAYKRTSLNMPLVNGVSVNGTTEFGTDGLYKFLRDGLACLVGLSWGIGSYAGVFASTLSNARSYSYDSAGGRASYNVKMS